MADPHALAAPVAMDYPEHERTYQRFISLVKAHVIGLPILLILMAIFLV